MTSRKKRLKKSRLYLIFDKKALGRTPIQTAAAKLRNSGIDIVQLRDKSSSKIEVLREALLLKKILSKGRVLFIINDYADIAAIAGADGVHLGQDDMAVRIARRLLGRGKLIGVSCHNLKQALAAQKNGADYIGIGPVFSTPTKPEYKAIGVNVLKKLHSRINIPYFAIGDINKNSIRLIKSAGANRAAVCRAVLKERNCARAVKGLKSLLLDDSTRICQE